MKILQIVADGNPGGGTTFVLEMLRTLENPILLSQKGSHLIREAQALDIKTYEIDFFTSRFDVRIPFQLQRVIRSVDPDIIHVHGNRAAFFLSFCKKRSPIVYTVHGLHGLYNGNCLGKWGEKQALKRADQIIFVSKWEEALAQKKKLLPHERHRVIYNGISLDDIPKSNSPKPQLLGFLGRLTPPKDPLFMLKVMDILGPKGYHLKMIGGGELEEKIKSHPHITVTGKLPRKEALEALTEVSAVIVPSKWEAFGLVLIEAIAMGIPIVAAKIPPFEEIVRLTGRGTLIEKKEAQKYADVILDTLQSPRPHRLNLVATFSWKECFRKYEAIFREFKKLNL